MSASIAPIRLKLVIDGADFGPLQQSASEAARRMADTFREALAGLARSGVLDVFAGRPGSAAHSAVGGAFAYLNQRDAASRQAASRASAPGSAGGWTSAMRGTPTTNGLASNVSAMAAAWAGVTKTAGGAWSVINKIPTALMSLASGIYIIRSLGAAIDRFLVRPFMDLGRFMFSATEDARKFVYSISSALGSLGRGWEVNDQLVARSRSITASVKELRESALVLASLPGLSGQVSFARSAEEVVSATEKFTNLQRKLAAIDPSQGDAGALVSLRNLAEGGPQAFTSIRRRFGISGKAIARQIVGDFDGDMRAAVEAATNDPATAANALSKYLDAIVPSETVSRYSRLISNRLDHLHDAIRAGIVKISESKAYDAISDRIKAVSDRLFDYIESPRYAAQAERIGTALARIINNVSDAIGRLLAKLTGGNSSIKTTGDLVEAITVNLETIAGWSDGLPEWADKLIGWARDFTIFIGDAADGIRDLVSALQDLRAHGLKGLMFGGGEGTAAPSSKDSWGKALRSYYAMGTKAPDITAPSNMRPDDLPPAVRALLKSEDSGGPAWASRQQTFASVLARIEVPESKDELTTVTRAARGILGANLSGDKSNVVNVEGIFDVMARDFQKSAERFTKAIDIGRAALESSPDNSELRDALGKLESTKAAAAKRFTQATADTADLLTESAKSFGEAIADTLHDMPAMAQVVIGERIAAGRSSYADRVSDVLGRAGFPIDQARDLGLESLPIEKAQKQTTDIVNARLSYAGDAGTYGATTVGMNAAQLREAFSHRASDDAIAAAQLQYLQRDGLARQEQILNRALADFDKNPTGEREIRNAAEAENAYSKLLARMDELARKTDYVRRSFEEFGLGVRNALEHSVGDAIYNLISGVGDLRDVLQSFAADVVRTFSDLAAKNVVRGLLGNLFEAQQNGTPGAGSGLIGGALGNILGLADGDVIDRATIAIVGEGAHPEAVIPMPRGRIPLGFDRDGLHAMLPGGRKIPTAIDGLAKYANGGVLGERATGIYSGAGAGSFHSVGAVEASTAMGASPPSIPFSTNDEPAQVFVISDPSKAWAAGWYGGGKQVMLDAVTGEIKNGKRVAKVIRRMSRG